MEIFFFKFLIARPLPRACRLRRDTDGFAPLDKLHPAGTRKGSIWPYGADERIWAIGPPKKVDLALGSRRKF